MTPLLHNEENRQRKRKQQPARPPVLSYCHCMLTFLMKHPTNGPLSLKNDSLFTIEWTVVDILFDGGEKTAFKGTDTSDAGLFQ